MKFPSHYKNPLISSLGTYIWMSALINLLRDCNSRGNIRNMAMFENNASGENFSFNIFFWIWSLFMTRVDHPKTKRVNKKKGSCPSLVTKLGQSWTLWWAVTSPSPVLSPTTRGQRDKRECLGTRLLLSWLKIVCEKQNSPWALEHCHVRKILKGRQTR